MHTLLSLALVLSAAGFSTALVWPSSLSQCVPVTIALNGSEPGGPMTDFRQISLTYIRSLYWWQLNDSANRYGGLSSAFTNSFTWPVNIPSGQNYVVEFGVGNTSAPQLTSGPIAVGPGYNNCTLWPSTSGSPLKPTGTPSSPSPTTPSRARSHIDAIIGGVVGGVAFIILAVAFMGYMRTRHRKHLDKVTRDTQGKPSLDDVSDYPTLRPVGREMEETATGDRLHISIPRGTSVRNVNPTTGRKWAKSMLNLTSRGTLWTNSARSNSGVYAEIAEEQVSTVASDRATWAGSSLPSDNPVVNGATHDVLGSSGEMAERNLTGEANVICEEPRSPRTNIGETIPQRGTPLTSHTPDNRKPARRPVTQVPQSPPQSDQPEPPAAGESRETEAELRRQLVAMQAQIERLIEMQGSRTQVEELGEEPPPSYDG
ncbi:hypothetical protein JAAARDRAFT_38935 [Jaapia argillacea MUCL 33604]|uniref:Mid2 domain-containing protein n=1 Tax=Jaapia argillacea MUCL 33604 TaxID=933084 RepID=A0A067PGD7_9AGAM|nr:hypothetical protein JAAARDRAFT_38935 [Jaapia argillacea MUCL 33604]